MKETYFGALFRKGANDLGYHPYPQPSANLSQPYTNPEGLTLQQCVFCGFCERYACEHYAKSSPQTIILPVLLKKPNYELPTIIHDFGGDNFDHSQLGFIGGQYVGAIMTNGRPIEFHPTPPGPPSWGLEWKKAVARHYNHTVLTQQHGTSTASRFNYLDLDPTYKDAWGQPLLRMTFDFPDNDVRMSQYIADKGVEIGRAMRGKIVVRGGVKRPYTCPVYQSTHNCGGAIMGDDP